MEKKSYITKEDYEKIYNKDRGYYAKYDWFEDHICNVCGEIIFMGMEKFEMEQEYIDDKHDVVTFCSMCKSLPNRNSLVKGLVEIDDEYL